MKIMKFFSVIVILNGLLLCFVGSFYVPIALSCLIFLIVTVAIGGGASNFNLVTTKTKTPIIVGVAVLAVALGGLAAYFAF